MMIWGPVAALDHFRPLLPENRLQEIILTIAVAINGVTAFTFNLHLHNTYLSCKQWISIRICFFFSFLNRIYSNLFLFFNQIYLYLYSFFIYWTKYIRICIMLLMKEKTLPKTTISKNHLGQICLRMDITKGTTLKKLKTQNMRKSLRMLVKMSHFHF